LQKLIYHHYNQFSPSLSPHFQRNHLASHHHHKATKKVNQDSLLLKSYPALGEGRTSLESREKPLSMSWITIYLTRDEWRRFLSRSSVVLCRRTMKLSCWPRIYVYKSKINSRYINYS